MTKMLAEKVLDFLYGDCRYWRRNWISVMKEMLDNKSLQDYMEYVRSERKAFDLFT